MPPKKSTKKTYSKRKNYRKTNYKKRWQVKKGFSLNPYSSIINQMKGNPAPLGDRLYTTLEYGYTDVITGSASVDTVFRMNSCYDPFYATGGAQPEGFDEIMLFFQKCRVNKFEVTATFLNTANIATQFSVFPCNVIGSYSNIDQVRAFPQCKTKYMSYGSATPEHGTTLYAGYRPRDIIGCTKQQYQDEDYSCTTTANPVHTPFCHLFVGSMDGSTAVGGYLVYKMKFYCEFYDRRQLNLS